MVQPDGMREVKGEHFLGQQVERNMRFWLGLLLEGKKKIAEFSFFSEYCNMM
jgi:hypothetical protein